MISFVEAYDRLSFMEAVEVLAARAGVELPRRRRKAKGADDRQRRLLGLLEQSSAYYQRCLRAPAGQGALAYLRGRGLEDATIAAFGVGFAPSTGDELVRKSMQAGAALSDLLEVGLARTSDDGRPYDFFRGRMTVPIRDQHSRTRGFGARRLNDADERAPKYVNTPETPLFHKGRLIYALDLALEHVRRSGHLILVEGYTDVMAAHQVGLRNVAAVLGTSTTDEHAALIRRTGARRVSLSFDGDQAGTAACMRALHGLLPLEVEIDVLRFDRFGPGRDPCDILIAEGAGAFEGLLEESLDWFAFLLTTLDGLSGQRRFDAIDRVLELIGRLRNPIHLDTRLEQFAAAQGHSVERVREQFEQLPQRRRERRRREEELRASRAAEAAGEQRDSAGGDPDRARLVRAWRELAGAVLSDSQLAARARSIAGECDEPPLDLLLERLCVWGAGDQPTIGSLMSELGGHPARDLVVPLLEEASTADSAEALLEGALACIERMQRAREIRAEARRAVEALDETEEKQRLAQLHAQLRRSKAPVPEAPQPSAQIP